MSDASVSPFKKWVFRFFIAIGMMTTVILGVTILFSIGKGPKEPSNVAHIKIDAPITSSVEEGELFGGYGAVASEEIVRLIQEITEDKNIKGILVEINSPGGTPVASEEIARALKNCQLPVVSWIREMGTSGAYWVAMAGDYVIAHPLSITGSIGVLANSFGFEKLLPKLQIEFRRQVAGKYKDIGTPFREPANYESEYIQGVLNQIHEAFIQALIEYRQLKTEEVENLTNGLFFTGKSAYEMKLVDQLGGKKEAIEWMKSKINEPVRLQIYKKRFSFFQSVFHGVYYGVQQFACAFGRGLIKSVAEGKMEIRC